MASKRPRIKTSHGARAEGQPRAKRAGSSETRDGDRVQKPSEPTTSERRPATRKARQPTPGEESLASPAAREIATLVAIAALDKKAMGLEILDVAGKVDYADFLVLMTGRSDRHVAALSQGIEQFIREKKSKKPRSVEGLPIARWVLMDFGDVVVHVFQDGVRTLYDLEALWMDAHRIPVPAGASEGVE